MSIIRSASGASRRVLVALFALAIACGEAEHSTAPSVRQEFTAVLTPVQADSIRLTYMCGTRFRVRNPTMSEASVTWDVYGTSTRGALVLPPRPPDAAHSETFFETGTVGTVRLFYAGRLVQTKANGNKVCAASSVHLIVVAGAGVTGGPLAEDTSVATGTRLHYAFATASGYRNLAVELDGVAVRDSGTIEMGQSRVLMVSAETEPVVNPADAPLLASSRAVLTSADPVAAYQQHLNAVTALFDAVGEDEAVRRLREIHFASYDPIADSAAISRVDEALGGKTFEIGGSFSSSRDNSGAAVTALRSSVSTGPQMEATTFFYLNGIFTDRDENAVTTNLLRRVLAEISDFRGATYRVSPFYNRTMRDQVEPLAVRRARCVAELADRGDRIGIVEIPRFYSQCTGEPLFTYLANFDLTEAARQYLDLTSRAPSGARAEADARLLAMDIQRERDAGRHVIVVPHSQGNMMTQQATNVLSSTLDPRIPDWEPPRPYYDIGVDSACIATVSLAAPTSRGWTLPVDRLRFVAVRGDLVPDIDNTAPSVDTDLSRQADREIASLERRAALLPAPVRILLMAYAGVQRTLWGLKLHKVNSSYLPYPESRGQIRDGARATYGGCAVDSLIVSPNDVALDRGWWIPLTPLFYNEQGTRIADRSVEWTSSDPSRLQVYEDGWISADFPSSFPQIWCGNPEPSPNVVYFDVTVTARSRGNSSAVSIRIRDEFSCSQ